MHLPDGFLDLKTAAATWTLGTGGLAVAARHAARALPRERIPLVGLAAAFVFAAQMINFPVAGGTSGHLLGGVLVATILGPGAAALVLASVLILQCLLFADGGITALGANVVNMALVGVFSGWLIFRAFSAAIPGRAGKLAGVAVGAWVSIVLGATTCAGQLTWSGTAPWRLAFPAMAGVHAVIGLGEAAISAMVWSAVVRARPELDGSPPVAATASSTLSFAALGMAYTLALALFVAPFACPWPDGLEKVADALGFASRASPPVLAAPIAEYAFPGFSNGALATAAAGAAGAILLFGAGWALALRRAPSSRRSP